MSEWYVDSWKNKPYHQAFEYANVTELTHILSKLQKTKPLIEVEEIHALQNALTHVAINNGFIVHLGDCAESFTHCTREHIHKKLNLMFALMQQLQKTTMQPLVGIGRIAGQFAKPRTHYYQTHGNERLPNYRGDLINSFEFNAAARDFNPTRMWEGYQHAKRSLELIRAYLTSIPFFVSHEALHLSYEQSFVRKRLHHYYLTSTHLPWIGMRTADVNGAHIEFVRGLVNPIAIKIGPETKTVDVIKTIELINPENIPGKLLLIHRFGSSDIQTYLPNLLEVTKKYQHALLWLCDPMHGNTKMHNGIKTRYMSDIHHELQKAFRIHHEANIPLSGVHFELSHEWVTECVGEDGLLSSDPEAFCYKTLCDPRLNPTQAQMLMEWIGLLLQQYRSISQENKTSMRTSINNLRVEE